MALAAGAAVVLPTVGALSTIAYYAKHPQDDNGIQKQLRRNSIAGDDSRREFIVDDDPSEFSSFSSAPSIFDAHMVRRKSQSSSMSSLPTQPDHKLLEEPQLQVWRDRYKWGRKYGMNFAHNDN
ncbi:hypothetical protein IW140_003508 [Coemansia sp. RSA 1813]|nr:hypothetical protein EV178_003402 [Coemansia sp. RSA 1646]KAJ1772926.1 hypothetical protein LPJ74_001065 [Coemansia sp. RSA 1843]KAJ2093501.1 hypothetical protein IW138_000352 [Coemansia sp. RSA 986]KAJ2214318.1 hypothetical protein EV179_003098 [Coemansia sp. RSA 487]KAJ2568884.1 hypothetical protein IW140_003508 [Coemansia sp. RSA 1813]